MFKANEAKMTESLKTFSEQLETLKKKLNDKQSAYQQEKMNSYHLHQRFCHETIVMRSQFEMEIIRRDCIIHQQQETLNFISRNGCIWQKISRGACGIVYQGTIPVAIKQPLGMSHQDVQLFLQEKKRVYSCQHPNLVQMFDVTDGPVIVMERLEGNLKQFLKEYYCHLKATHVKRLALDIANGLSHLHGQKPPIFHRDLKPENILLRRKGDFYIAKIGDYGTLRTHCDKMTPNRGTLIYAAPEGQTRDKQSPKMDIYSYGLVLWEICTGKPPNCQVQMQIDPNFKKIIDACTLSDPTRRPEITEVITFLNQLNG